MKIRMIVLLLLIVCLVVPITSNAGTGPVRAELAQIFEDSVKKAKSVDKSLQSIQIIESSDTYLIIGKINGMDVCSKDVENLVAILQDAIEEHPSIDRNIGPYIFSFIDDDGKRRSYKTKEVEKNIDIPKCRGIYVSVPK